MTKPIFIRLRGKIVNITNVTDIYSTDSGTSVDHASGGSTRFEGDVRDELWGLIKLALADKDEAPQAQDVQPELTLADPEPARVIIGQLVDGTPVYAA